MREIVLDTETTGFSFADGDRIVEIGCVEIMNLLPTGNYFHMYFNPERPMPEEAFGVHGIGPDLLVPPRLPEPGHVTLKDKPLFDKGADEFLDFIGDAPLIIHNAPFDMGFLNGELVKAGKSELTNKVTDTLTMARRKFPTSATSLDALCKRFKIDNTNRTLHGALLDSEILAEVYMELSGGRNYNLTFEAKETVLVNILDSVPLTPGDIKTSDVNAEGIFKPSETEIAENNDFRDKNGFERGVKDLAVRVNQG